MHRKADRPRLRTHNQKMTAAARQMAEKKTVRPSVIACCNTPPVLELSEHDLDAIAALIFSLVVFD